MKSIIELLGGGVMMLMFVLIVDCVCGKKKVPLAYLCWAKENYLLVRLVELWRVICSYCGETYFH